jgi:diguanylate cyclase
VATSTPEDRDLRLDQLVELVVTLASGELGARMAPSTASDEIDAVIVGLNMLAEELQALNTVFEERVAERTQQLEAAQQQLRQLALYDPLTGLANRTLLGDRIAHALALAARGAPSPAVLLLDLDGFKAVNDSFGHAVGDLLLVEIARRLRAVVRESDTVGRLGGDEFALVVIDAAENPVLDVAERVRAALSRPVLVGGHSCWVGASIGVRFAERGLDAGTLLRDADTAMYVAKTRARGGVEVYEPSMHTAAMTRVQMAEELRRAMANGELQVHYQPIVDLATERTTGVEALVRWDHPVRGMLPPAHFVPIAEETGLLVALDRWVLDTAVAQLATWRRTLLDGAKFGVNVNVSPLELRSPRFADEVVACLTRHGADPGDLTLEVTETQTMGEDGPTLATMTALRDAGVGVAIDDFGTGCSSLSYVRRLVVDVVKIDRSLVTGLDTDPQQHRIAAAMLGVVAAFGLVAVAEGVETAQQADELRALGCRYGQGYVWGRPVPAAEMTRLLDASGP